MYSKTMMKANRVDTSYRFTLIYLCKRPNRAALVKYVCFIEVSSHSNISLCLASYRSAHQMGNFNWGLFT